MECVEGALNGSFVGVGPNNPQPLPDDLWAINGVSGDDLFVDGLLDFSEDGGFVEVNDNTLQNPDDTQKTPSISPAKTDNDGNTTSFSLPETELCLPADDVADLEWVSHFVDVDDSFPGDHIITFSAGKWPEYKPKPEPVTLVTGRATFSTPVHTKARSKRTRTGGRVWSLGLSPLTDSSTSCSSSSSCTSNPLLILHDSSQTAESIIGKPINKRQKKKAGSGLQQPRRCSHCLVQKTPQWRAGPLGAKTLCNACGVRFKSGRLLPEYRPACSPTFSSEVHSNNHRKVLEMRQKKEAADTGLNLPVQGF